MGVRDMAIDQEEPHPNPDLESGEGTGSQAN
ncbi:hypothetical protein Oscil6304_3205 [Oscillatoria acuminata PCC 6304]|uniref:Uncharacterized protein n=1 Tax=Oscillatoria acuminata PCC 6304 TaxID=56110 RepID=K9TK74_9CYAN|nr:hypothetical protein Oscil6304_3205 [Oscillatoria acuminata PCC 6304]